MTRGDAIDKSFFDRGSLFGIVILVLAILLTAIAPLTFCAPLHAETVSKSAKKSKSEKPSVTTKTKTLPKLQSVQSEITATKKSLFQLRQRRERFLIMAAKLDGQLAQLRERLAEAGQGVLSVEATLDALNSDYKATTQAINSLTEQQVKNRAEARALIAGLQILSQSPARILSLLPFTSLNPDNSLMIQSPTARNAPLDKNAASELKNQMTKEGRGNLSNETGAMTSVEVARAYITLKHTLPLVEQRTKLLKANMQSLSDLRAKLQGQKQRLQSVNDKLATRRQIIAELLSRKINIQKQLQTETIALQSHTNYLTRNLHTLQELLNQLDVESNEKSDQAIENGEITASIPSSKNLPTIKKLPKDQVSTQFANLQRTIPANGVISLKWGERDAMGINNRGIFITTRGDATIVSPASGIVEFADQFRSYGLTLIISLGNGYSCVISGLGRLDVTVGEKLTVGQPVGAMVAPSLETQSLFFTVRKNNKFINPQLWLAESKK